MVGIDGLQEMLFVRVYWKDWMRTYLPLELVKEKRHYLYLVRE